MYGFVGCRGLKCRAETLLSTAGRHARGADKKIARFKGRTSVNDTRYIFLKFEISRIINTEKFLSEYSGQIGWAKLHALNFRKKLPSRARRHENLVPPYAFDLDHRIARPHFTDIATVPENAAIAGQLTVRTYHLTAGTFVH
jgi:hypothetical protein